MLRACVGLAALTLLVGSVPTYDSWAWMAWGREIASGLPFDTSVGPAWKPLPVAVGMLGEPWLWLVVARAGALAAVVLAGRLAWRLADGSRLAGCGAALGVALCGGWMWNGWLGNAEGLMLAFVLGAFSCALDGRHRAALGLGFAAALLRTEVVPFLAVYALWAWREERAGGARGAAAPPPGGGLGVLAAAGFAALPALWLVPDLIGSGDALRSSERARIPNPGAPALADRPALESLGRAVALAPALLWAGAALALLGAWRRGLPRAAVVPAAAGAAWIGLVAAMSELGYSGEERYALPGVALAAVSAGAGLAWAAAAAGLAARPRPALPGAEPAEYKNVPHRDVFVTAPAPGGSARGPGDDSVAISDVLDTAPSAGPRLEPARRVPAAALGAVLLAAAFGQAWGGLRDDVRAIAYEQDLYGSLEGAVAAAGGREAVLRCAPIHTAPYSRPALAWRLRIPMSAISTEPAARGTAFRARPYRGARMGPELRGVPQPRAAGEPRSAAEPRAAGPRAGGWTERARSGEWTVVERCG